MQSPIDNIRILIEEENVISLRAAYVQDDGDLVDLRLMPASLNSSVPAGGRRGDLTWATLDRAWLYRRLRSPR